MNLNFPLCFSTIALIFAIFALRGYQDLLWRVTELEDREERRRRREKKAQISDEQTTLTEEKHEHTTT